MKKLSTRTGQMTPSRELWQHTATAVGAEPEAVFEAVEDKIVVRTEATTVVVVMAEEEEDMIREEKDVLAERYLLTEYHSGF